MAEALFVTCAAKIGVSRSLWCAAPWLDYTNKASECCGVSHRAPAVTATQPLTTSRPREGLCSQPAINGDGTLYGTIVGSFFNLLIVWFQPDGATMWIIGQLIATGEHSLFRGVLSVPKAKSCFVLLDCWIIPGQS